MMITVLHLIRQIWNVNIRKIVFEGGSKRTVCMCVCMCIYTLLWNLF